MAFEVDGITYVHPYEVWSQSESVYVRPIFQIYEDGARLVQMRVNDNTPKGGLMDSPIDEAYLKGYWND